MKLYLTIGLLIVSIFVKVSGSERLRELQKEVESITVNSQRLADEKEALLKKIERKINSSEQVAQQHKKATGDLEREMQLQSGECACQCNCMCSQWFHNVCNTLFWCWGCESDEEGSNDQTGIN
jgi:hypothetical protein